jgi:hypothetical protein
MHTSAQKPAVQPRPSAAVPQGRIAAAARHTGVEIGFTVRALIHARLRLGDDEAEVMVPVGAGRGGMIVVPLKQLANAYTLNEHDHELVKRLAAEKDLTLAGVRALRLAVAADGFAGEEARNSARGELNRQETLRLLTRFFVIRAALRAVTGRADQAYLTNLDDPANRRRLRADLAGIAARMGVTTDDTITILEEWGEAIGLIGVPDMPQPGFARQLVQQIDAMAGDLQRACEDEDEETALRFQRLATRARAVVEECVAAIRRLDQCAVASERVLTRWKQLSESISRDAANVDWALDGWDRIVAGWRGVLEASPAERLAFVVATLEGMPPLVSGDVSHTEERTIIMAKGRTVQACRDWRTGRIDQELLGATG